MTLRVTRRAFLKAGGAIVAAAAMTGCQNPRRWVVLEPYVRPPEEQLAGVATWYASTCRQCPAGCGIVVRVMNGRALKIEGNPENPLNQGKLCGRGQAGLQRLYNPDRLAGPVRQVERGSRAFQPLSWNEALNSLSSALGEAGSRIAIWDGTATPSHLHYLFERFAAALGAPAPVRFDLYSAYSGYDRLQQAEGDAFDQPMLPAYDLAQADLVLSFGADFLGTWLSAVRYGVDYGKFRGQPLGKRGYLVHIEPRMSVTAARADQWLAARPGTETMVAQAILRLIADQALGPADRVARAQELAPAIDVNEAAARSDVAVDDLSRLAQLFVTSRRPLAIPGQTSGLVPTVQALNAVAAADGQPGGAIPSTPMPLTDLAPAGVSSLSEVQSLADSALKGEIDVLLIHGANPIYELPQQMGIGQAIAQVPLVVSFASLVDETAVQSDLILPDHETLESWGYEVVGPNFGLPIVGSLQPIVTPLLETRATADVILEVAGRVPETATALPWPDEVAFLKEIIGRLPPGAAGGSGSEVLWSRFLQHGGWWPAMSGAAPSAAGEPPPIEVALPQEEGGQEEYPYILYLYLSELLSDGRGASQPWLQGAPAPMTTIAWQSWMEIHPTTAEAIGVDNGDIVRVTSDKGELELPVYVYPAIRPDTVAIPLGQGHADLGRFAESRGANPVVLAGLQIATADTPIRVQLTPTGRRVALATFENVEGVREGFINQGLPG
ncbi:MAG: molybdopterin-containing oxidoreductase family protein [Candidatus Promineifilaceae bacterium]